MIEKEQIYVDFLRSQIASSPDEKKYSELAKTEKIYKHYRICFYAAKVR